MSFFGKFKSFFEAVGGELERIFGSSTFEQKVLAVISYAGPLVVTITQLIGGPVASGMVANIINAIKTDFATVSTVVQAGTVTAGTPLAATLQTALNSIKNNLAALLASAEVKNSSKATEITNYVSLVDGEVTALLANLPSASAPAVPATPAVAKA